MRELALLNVREEKTIVKVGGIGSSNAKIGDVVVAAFRTFS